jgi:probable H4MPT-linked C1 transfer pathway protein
MTIELIGWDIGGAHLKAVAIADDGSTQACQEPTPLWLGLDPLHRAIAAIKSALQPAANCRHAVTMTGELVDLFTDRTEGVTALIDAFGRHFAPEPLHVFAGGRGFLRPDQIRPEHAPHIASANWAATALWAATQRRESLLVDIGSTTTDLIVLAEGRPAPRGTTDCERLRFQELVYTGITRTSLMALADTAPWRGEWTGLMAEHFATTADVYRLTGELPDHADLLACADGGDKTVAASARRLARLLGCDAGAASLADWQRLARYFRDRQLSAIQQAWHRQLSTGMLEPQCSVIGAGVGRFLVQELASRLGHPYQDIADLFPPPRTTGQPSIADCAPAAAVACLLRLGS